MALVQKQAEPLSKIDASFNAEYLTTLTLIERLHRQLLDVVKNELDRTKTNQINGVQALLLFNIGDDKMTAGELRSRGHYLGSNVSYNLKKLVKAEYLSHQRSATDKRAIHVCLTEKGQRVRNVIQELFNRQLQALEPVANVGNGELQKLNGALLRLERYWSDHIRFQL
ncbi:Transcriptional regulator, MarR family [hydrothermal vent metagenome]|uniref:Transcriptional regulator, MarR family n=1 Tax=hydrothermal vent metagenome TaxID=652676 RepID=A0A3B0RS37_9ZZZZ